MRHPDLRTRPDSRPLDASFERAFADVRERVLAILAERESRSGAADRTTTGVLQPPLRPAVELVPLAAAYLLRVAVPGLHINEIEIEIEGRARRVRLRTVLVHRHGSPEARVEHCTPRCRRLACEVELPGDADADQIRADLEGGILTIRVPRVPVPQARVPAFARLALKP